MQSQGAIAGVLPVAASVAQLEPENDRASGEPPQTYELLSDIISHLGGRVDHVVIARTDLGATVGRILIAMETGDTLVVHAQPGEAVAWPWQAAHVYSSTAELFDSSAEIR
jgi:bifunctional DNase/RNase